MKIDRDVQIKRLSWLLGEEATNILANKTVVLFGCGGVGSFAMEALVRSGIGCLIIVDGDDVDPTNINRQLVANYNTVGMRKVDAAKEHCKNFGAYTKIVTYDMMYTKENYPSFFDEIKDLYGLDYVIDAVDMVVAKINIIEESKRLDVPVISSMGMGNKLDPTQIEIVDIAKTSVCPLARVMRRELKKRRIRKVPVAYSKEIALKPQSDEADRSPGSCAFVPSVAGLAMAGYVIRELSKFSEDN